MILLPSELFQIVISCTIVNNCTMKLKFIHKICVIVFFNQLGGQEVTHLGVGGLRAAGCASLAYMHIIPYTASSFTKEIEPIIIFKTDNRISSYYLTSLIIRNLINWQLYCIVSSFITLSTNRYNYSCQSMYSVHRCSAHVQAIYYKSMLKIWKFLKYEVCVIQLCIILLYINNSVRYYASCAVVVFGSMLRLTEIQPFWVAPFKQTLCSIPGQVRRQLQL